MKKSALSGFGRSAGRLPPERTKNLLFHSVTRTGYYPNFDVKFFVTLYKIRMADGEKGLSLYSLKLLVDDSIIEEI